MRFLSLIVFTGLVASSCNDNSTTTNRPFIPNVPVNITINTDLPSYYHLQTPGNYALVNGGSRGIFLVHNFDDVFYAVERTCTYHPDDSCAFVQIDSGNIQLKCGTFVDGKYEACCASKYAFEGTVLQGPSVWALKQYNVFENGNLITIRN
ncbi:MAG: hypothetical protein H6608_07055 [Flavobacteriales bacterium]|nr:hypothetical protein [Bacteroidota bacterium]MCB9240870.1 hypothetical protein [Flavobacteriales bacterium]